MIFALVDCNNFFVSCERLFRPELLTTPVVVLSSNDGCAVSRSNEAKALGIPMGAPAFKYRQLFKTNGVVSFSANFELYGDLSRRLTQILTEVTPRVEVYSVDECFLDLSELAINDFTKWAKDLKARVWRDIGIPVSIGIAGSKTLAKIATDIGKQTNGVCDLYHMTPAERQVALSKITVRNIWGIGRRLAPQLQAHGVTNAAEMSRLRTAHARQLMGVHGEQMVYELNGTSCIPLEREHKLQKMISRGRTFGEDTNQAHVVEAALASFATAAAFRLRESGQLTGRLSVWLSSDRHKPGYRQWGKEVTFGTPTADTGQIIATAIAAFSELYDQHASYHRASVTLHNFLPDGQLQTDILGEVSPALHTQKTARLQAVDGLNKRYGKGMVHYAAADLADNWEPRKLLRSPRYTTNWDELAKVRPV